MGAAIKWAEANEGDNRMIREVAEATKLSRETFLNGINTTTGEKYSLMSWVSAYWRASHQAETGYAGLVFMLFPDEIVDRLKDADASKANVIKVYGCQYGAWAAPERTPWKGQKVIIRASTRTGSSGKIELTLDMKWTEAKTQTGWHYLGIVGEGEVPFILPGHTREVRIYSTAFINGLTKGVKLFDLSMSQEDINDYLPVRP